jgi:23S rRNA (cytidine1920-2'-O)/16S rRNA (cytidine1409-2'-O)-methyltransferase
MARERQRLDVALVERGVVDTRSKAQSLVMARRILVNGKHVDKPGAAVKEDDQLTVEELEHPWVGRGGMKLAQAVKHYSLDLTNRICADVGASTGGFTDVMLKNGAEKVYAIDVGYGQLDQSLRTDPRVVNREKVNARYLDASAFEEPIDFVSIDVSFISLRLILPAVLRFLRPGGELVALIKPQFEVGKADLGKGGIVRNEAARAEVVEMIVTFARNLGFDVRGVIDSPIKGAEGNVEFLMYAVLANGGDVEASVEG